VWRGGDLPPKGRTTVCTMTARSFTRVPGLPHDRVRVGAGPESLGDEPGAQRVPTEAVDPGGGPGSKQHENNDYEPILSGVDVGFPWTMGWRAAGLSDQQPSHPAGPGSVPCGGSVMFS
jgi:hypothetical protein